MTDSEFDILDELYFVSSFRDLLQKTGLPAPQLKEGLRACWSKALLGVFGPTRIPNWRMRKARLVPSAKIATIWLPRKACFSTTLVSRGRSRNFRAAERRGCRPAAKLLRPPAPAPEPAGHGWTGLYSAVHFGGLVGLLDSTR
ncbi:hypothetical protein [Hymenobacter volaticus]|uniref:Uncharacterized protein n=1 Tax=Hymenobacter volaticus TaxID=2932254 RepID=A0ABY4GAD5_9BACT|nr:hypothetical protein [Hymenobacter volaticus]UOQ67711.1 hypothetical protein MUN86_07570 [Hymenobacter volaticus]